jgi:hypothetical protein
MQSTHSAFSEKESKDEVRSTDSFRKEHMISAARQMVVLLQLRSE